MAVAVHGLASISNWIIYFSYYYYWPYGRGGLPLPSPFLWPCKAIEYFRLLSVLPLPHCRSTARPAGVHLSIRRFLHAELLLYTATILSFLFPFNKPMDIIGLYFVSLEMNEWTRWWCGAAAVVGAECKNTKPAAPQNLKIIEMITYTATGYRTQTTLFRTVRWIYVKAAQQQLGSSSLQLSTKNEIVRSWCDVISSLA